MRHPITPEDVEGWHEDTELFEDRMVRLCAALLPRERRLIEQALEELQGSVVERISGSHVESWTPDEVTELWDLFDNAWVGPEVKS